MSGAERRSRASVLTPAGRGAIAVIAAEGSAALAAVESAFRAANGRPLAEQAAHRIVFGHWSDGAHREEVVVVRGAGDSLEVHCHGGAAAVDRIVAALAAGGCEIAPWREHVARQHGGGVRAEAAIALAEATTRRAAAILLDQFHGALSAELEAAASDLRQGRRDAARTRLMALLETARIGEHLTRPWQVVIAGRPNVGKSSLLNALVGHERAIVFERPGTTRDVLSADTAIAGWPVRLFDGAGLREATEPIEAEGVARARRQLESAELVLWVLDATTLSTGDDPAQAAAREIAAEAGAAAAAERLLVAVNKVDLATERPVSSTGAVVGVSALTGWGLDALLAAISQRLAPSPPPAGAAVVFTPRQESLVRAALAKLDAGDVAGAAMILEGG